MSKKYNEIMDKVVVTDEMHERLLAQISAADPELLRGEYETREDETFANAFTGKKIRKFQPARALGLLAAACALILIGVAVSRVGMKSEQAVQYYEEGAAAAAEEAEEAVGASEFDTEMAAPGEQADSYAASAEDADADTTGGTFKAETTEDRADTAPAAAQTDEEETAEADAGAQDAYPENEDEAVNGTSGEAINLSEEEIRQVVEEYIGEGYEISDMTQKDGLITYIIVESAAVSSVNSYFRIDVDSGKVQVTDAETGEIEKLNFRDMMDK